MMIDPVSAVLVGLCLVVAYLIWDKKKVDAQIDHMIDQHNGLCQVIAELVDELEEQFERLEEQQND
jgi:hypothetical protein